MAGLPPMGGPPGGPPPGMGAPPGGAPPPPPPPPAPPPAAAPKPATPFANLTDLPSELSGGPQMLDGVCRQLKLTLRHPDFATKPKTVAVLSSLLETATELVSHMSGQGDAGGAPTSVINDSSEKDGDDAHFTSADADTTPPMEDTES
jgi:hypothetical protein